MKKHLDFRTLVSRLIVTVVMCLPAWGIPVLAQEAESYAVFDAESATLTFRHDAAKPEGAYALNEGLDRTQWSYLPSSIIKKVVFDASFAAARPTTCRNWFNSCSSLKTVEGAHPTNQGERFHKPKEKLYICTMNTQGLLALAQLILPSEILSNFEVVRVEEESSLIRIYLDESVRAEYKENPKIESKGFCDAVTIRDFPIRDKGVDLMVRRRKWYDRQNNRYFSDSYDLKAEGTRYSKEFAAFLKGVYGDDPYDLPFA